MAAFTDLLLDALRSLKSEYFHKFVWLQSWTKRLQQIITTQ